MSSSARLLASAPAPAPASRMLSAFIVGGIVDDRVLEEASRAVLDTLAVTIAGGGEPGVRALVRALEPAQGGTAVRSFWGPETYRADDAALLYGMASHVLDYDDVSMLTVCHPSAPVLSALLAVGGQGNRSGRQVLEAFAIGTEVLIRLGQSMGFRHYALGFHATATLGAIGAAAAIARLEGLDERRTGYALAIAASMASGLRKNFGSMVKSLHVGMAAANGLKAVRLATAGIEGTAEPFEEEGFLKAFSGGGSDTWPAGLALGRPFAIVEPGFEQKRYPCCYMLHKMIEAALGLRRDHGIALADVSSVRVDMPPGGTKPLIHPYPKTGLNALFSGPYAIAASLADGHIDLGSFADAAVARAEIQARLPQVAIVEETGEARTGSDLGSAPVTVTVTLTGGRTLARTISASPGSVEDPLTIEQLRAKWLDCLQRAQPALDAGLAGRLFDQGLDLAGMPGFGAWLDALRETVTRD